MPLDYQAHRQAASVARSLGIDFSKERFTVEDLARGINVEREHGKILSAAQCGKVDTNVTDDDILTTAKIALAHLYERREGLSGGRCSDGRDTQFDYYDGLELVETAPVGYWRGTAPASYWANKRVGFIVVSTLIFAMSFLLLDAIGWVPMPRYAVMIIIIGAITKLVYLAATWK
jgi:hypothetical protein